MSSFSFNLKPLVCSPQTHSKLPSQFRPRRNFTSLPSLSKQKKLFLSSSSIKSCSAVNGNHEHRPSSANAVSEKPRWEIMLGTAASLYPVYVTVGGIIACLQPTTFSWFVKRGPASYSFALGFIMLAMGLTLELKDLFNLFMQRPLSILFGFAAQYTIMPAFGMVVSKCLGLSPSLSVGLILLSCCPGGTASNVVTLIAQGDVPLSIVMTVCTTVGAVFLTPLLTKLLAGTYVPIDAVKLSISTLQVVVAPILLGSYIQSKFPNIVKVITPFAPLLAVLASSLLACSVFSENVVRLKASMASASVTPDLSALLRVQEILSGELGLVILSVMLLHFLGFFVGYLAAAVGGFKESQRRAISIEHMIDSGGLVGTAVSILMLFMPFHLTSFASGYPLVEVGMQNSSLGVVLATSHFASQLVALPPAMSAVIMNIMGSTLGFIWRYIDLPSESSNGPKLIHDK